MRGTILRVAVSSPLRRLFDYLPPKDVSTHDELLPGIRVRVPFGRMVRIGLVTETAKQSDIAPNRLKHVLEILDTSPLLPLDTIALLRWASKYYHHPIGDAILGTLPALLKGRGSARLQGPRRWRLTAMGKGRAAHELSRAPRQATLFNALRTHPDGVSDGELKLIFRNYATILRPLEKKGWVESFRSHCWERMETLLSASVLRPEPAQLLAIQAITAARNRFEAFLLDGVTSSGKTEVYLSVIEDVVSRNRQALVLVPEIGLTPQTVTRFRRRISAPVVVLHSSLTDSERSCNWFAARDGEALVVIDTRSAVFAPLDRPGVFIVDEEHDPSYKQQNHFRYSARDVAVYRARQAGVPLVLGSATPSLESLHNANLARYRRLTLPERAQGAIHPTYSVTDVRGKPFRNGLSHVLLRAIGDCLSRKEQALLFLNRRGYAPTRLCHHCGWVANCERCDAHMVHHANNSALSDEEDNCSKREYLRCHHCGAERQTMPHCPKCGGKDLRSLGIGTQRITRALTEHFPNAKLVRVDRDSIRRKGALEKILSDVTKGTIDILVGTQMLAKGHHFPNVTLVGIVDADGGLFGADFRAGERMAQTVIQVAGRAGRGDHPGQVLIQTHHPNHPSLQALIREGYHHFAQTALEERYEAALAPFYHLALVRTESVAREAGMICLGEARALAETLAETELDILGPAPAPMERRGGRYRAQLLFKAPNRRILHRFLVHWIPHMERLKSAKQVRWSLDVDPQEMF
uniref:Replication restart protein PriA n=1 Tax=Candidatus Kentrum sp. TC TaxID=2126339 RepID=A0A450YYH9_9GAMM|nr:MAG: replication restart DNA helicase PriA [Candidatus Kentron sp. TC]